MTVQMDAVCRCSRAWRVHLDAVVLPATVACRCGRDAVLVRPLAEPRQPSLFGSHVTGEDQ